MNTEEYTDIRLEIAIAMLLSNKGYENLSREDILNMIEKSYQSITHI
jgi:hypothetical protein